MAYGWNERACSERTVGEEVFVRRHTYLADCDDGCGEQQQQQLASQSVWERAVVESVISDGLMSLTFAVRLLAGDGGGHGEGAIVTGDASAVGADDLIGTVGLAQIRGYHMRFPSRTGSDDRAGAHTGGDGKVHFAERSEVPYWAEAAQRPPVVTPYRKLRPRRRSKMSIAFGSLVSPVKRPLGAPAVTATAPIAVASRPFRVDARAKRAHDAKRLAALVQNSINCSAKFGNRVATSVSTASGVGEQRGRNPTARKLPFLAERFFKPPAAAVAEAKQRHARLRQERAAAVRAHSAQRTELLMSL